MKRKYKKMIFITVGLVLLAIVGYIIVNVSIDNYQLNRNQKIIKELQADNASSNILVVFFQGREIPN